MSNIDDASHAIRCNVDEGVDVHVAGEVKGWVKVIVNGKVNSGRADLMTTNPCDSV